MILISIMFAFIACAAALCVFLLTHMMSRGEELARVLEAQLTGVGETHLLGFQAMTSELKRLEKRVKEIEDEVL